MEIARHRIDIESAASFRINTKDHLLKSRDKTVVDPIVPANDLSAHRRAEIRFAALAGQTDPRGVQLQAAEALIQMIHSPLMAKTVALFD